MTRTFVTATVLAGVVLLTGLPARAQEAGTVTVLETLGAWRVHQMLEAPMLDVGEGPEPLKTPLDWLNRPTAAPPAGWTQPDFDDSAWLGGTARAFAQTCYLSRLCLRGRFEVTDPAAVKDLMLKLSYYGGAIVTVNGKELTRAHLPKGSRATLAEGYPTEAFVDDKGKIVPSGWMASRFKAAMAARERKLPATVIPAKMLRKGVNVVAIEIVRAPYHKIVSEKKVPSSTSGRECTGACPTTSVGTRASCGR